MVVIFCERKQYINPGMSTNFHENQFYHLRKVSQKIHYANKDYVLHEEMCCIQFGRFEVIYGIYKATIFKYSKKQEILEPFVMPFDDINKDIFQTMRG
jgi:hypothetical protein